MERERALNSTLSKWILIGLGWAAFALFFASELVLRRAYAGFPPNTQRALAFYGGNYNDPALFIPQNVYVPQLILPAVN